MGYWHNILPFASFTASATAALPEEIILVCRRATDNSCSLLNSDTIVTPDFLQPLVGYLREHPQAGIVQGKMILSRHGNALDVCGSFLTRFGFLYHYGYWKQGCAEV